MSEKRTADSLVAWLQEAAHEIANAHLTLDMYDKPRTSSDGTELSLAARIAVALDPEGGP